MLLRVVVLLLFVLGPPAPAGSERNSRKYFDVEIQDDEYDDGDDDSDMLGHSPWLAYDQQLRLVGGTSGKNQYATAQLLANIPTHD